MAKKRKKTRKKKIQKRSLKKDIALLRAEERKIVKEEKKIEKMERKILREEKKIEKLEHQLIEEEHDLIIALGKFKFKKSHILDFFKIVGGALIGTSFGVGLVRQIEVAESLPWTNVIGIFILSLFIASALIYKAEKKSIMHKKHPGTYVLLRLIYIWLIAIFVGGLSSFLFLTEPVESVLFAKVILVGSYPALAGAVGFNFV